MFLLTALFVASSPCSWADAGVLEDVPSEIEASAATPETAPAEAVTDALAPAPTSEESPVTAVPSQTEETAVPQEAPVEEAQAALPSAPAPASVLSLPEKNIYAEEFFMPAEARLRQDLFEVDGFFFIKTPSREHGTNYSIVTEFKGNSLRSKYVRGLLTDEDIRKFVKEKLKTADYEGVMIRRLSVPSVQPGGKDRNIYWVGHRAFAKADDARSQIALVKTIAESQGADFPAMVESANRYVHMPEPPPSAVIKPPAQQAKEEALFLKWMDQLDIGESLYGPFQGTPTGEPILWQSFGETTWRHTNFDSKNFGEQVGYWTNRVSFKGLRAPIATIDPYVEVTGAMESSGIDFKDYLHLIGGLEWRPFERMPFFQNFRPYGLPLLIWVRNYRFFAQYEVRRNIKDEISGSPHHNLVVGFQIFYEWGVDPAPATEPHPDSLPEYLRRYSWGEYFGEYAFETTGFSAQEDFDAYILNSSLILGFKTPGIPLPPNPINDKLVFMPYFRYEHVDNLRYRIPYQNRNFVGVGVRWMPFSNWRYAENEWLAKIKVFGEYDGIGKAQYTKTDNPPNDVRTDWRIGVAWSSRRY
ncbi:MAG: hypothetical protein ACOY3K_03750 [Candidatus Omnitrophota bacterium]